MIVYVSLKEFTADISLYVQFIESSNVQSLPLSNCTNGQSILPLLLFFTELPVWKEPSALPPHFADHFRCPKKVIHSRRTSILERAQSVQDPNMVTKGYTYLTGKIVAPQNCLTEHWGVVMTKKSMSVQSTDVLLPTSRQYF